mmetsp:Transcript_47565/g.95162  ORF Transcript_47565/g.95162 Transcript_47565/m.95162 type:complete len:210 (+) Transcript_47565:660-1289(+)
MFKAGGLERRRGSRAMRDETEFDTGNGAHSRLHTVYDRRAIHCLRRVLKLPSTHALFPHTEARGNPHSQRMHTSSAPQPLPLASHASHVVPLDRLEQPALHLCTHDRARLGIRHRPHLIRQQRRGGCHWPGPRSHRLGELGCAVRGFEGLPDTHGLGLLDQRHRLPDKALLRLDGALVDNKRRRAVLEHGQTSKLTLPALRLLVLFLGR